MNARICDRCGAVWKGDPDKAMYILNIGFYDNCTTIQTGCVKYDLCKECLGGLENYLKKDK